MTLFKTSPMNNFLWKIAGADEFILMKSGEQSRKRFQLIGILFLIVNLVVFIGFLGLFYSVFNNVFIALLGTVVLGFLISNIYRLTLMSLEPQVLPVSKESSTKVYSNIVRVSSVVAFAFFASKTFEMVFIGLLETTALVKYEGASGYLFHMTTMNERYPSLWLITLLIIVLFIVPVYLKHGLRTSQEYYSLKRRIDRQLVEDNYKSSKRLKDELHAIHYVNEEVAIKRNTKGLLVPVIYAHKKEYISKEEHFEDPPFNTKRKSKERVFKSSEEFTSLFG